MTEEKELDEAALKIFNSFRQAYQDKGWTQKHVAELVGENPQQVNRALRGLDNTPKSKEIRNKAREILGI